MSFFLLFPGGDISDEAEVATIGDTTNDWAWNSNPFNLITWSDDNNYMEIR